MARLPAVFFPCMAFISSSSGSFASRSDTASASLKNTIFPSTSIKHIWFVSDIFSVFLPNLLLLASTSCSINFCILSLSAFVSTVRVSIWFCRLRNILIRSDLSMLFNSSSVYLISITTYSFSWH